MWRRSGDSTMLWWATTSVLEHFGLVWDWHGVLTPYALSDSSPALVATSDGGLICAWKGVGEIEPVWFSRWDGGVWSEPQAVVGSETEHSPSLAVFDGAVHLAWAGQGLALRLARLDERSGEFALVSVTQRG